MGDTVVASACLCNNLPGDPGDAGDAEDSFLRQALEAICKG